MSYNFDILSHSLVLLFLLPPAYGFLLGTVSLVDSHLLVPVQNLPLISILLYFGRLLRIFVVHFLSTLIFVFSFLLAFPFFLCFLSDFVFLLRHFVSFLLILYYSLLFLYIPLSGLHQILGYPYLLAIYLILFYFFDFGFHYLFYFFHFLHCCDFYLPFSIYLHLFQCICFDISQHAILSLY